MAAKWRQNGGKMAAKWRQNGFSITDKFNDRNMAYYPFMHL